ncbi:hypothetical protein PQ455_18345 [Sphingomonas naphthae]|uniref:Glycosyltransferase RgtA/B/C/D-like domain-containing protein n=1 Tax=Sphingomonas naphthae TaxID=1813468 RepID=A0ABY7TMB3_9SPHN|nr:hypothetical protein [Sphingomonas naphthae]WCT73540.1 hypothetical protein PQ455_18345 [Sphingomonas naphthae]
MPFRAIGALSRRIAASPWALGSVAALAFLLRYVVQAGLPQGDGPKWWGYFDQARYLRSAVALAHGGLDAADHWYPLGYALVAAPFARVMPADPFLIPDCLLFGVALVGFARTMRHLGLGPRASAAIFVATNLLIWPYAKLWVVPWTTSLSAALLWWLLALAGDLLAEGRAPVSHRVRDRLMVAMGALAGALPLVRPTEALTSATVGLVVGWTLYRQRRLTLRAMACAVGTGLALVLPYLALHGAIYGPRASDYAVAAALQGFNLPDLPWKMAVVLVSARPWFPDGHSLIEGFPAIVPGLAGLIALTWALPSHARRLLGLIALIALPYCLLFLAYTDLQPPGIWDHSNAHYFKWLFPLLVAGCWFLIDGLRDRRRRGPAVAALAAIGLAMCVRPIPVPVGEDVPARMLLFRGDTTGFWEKGRPTKAWDAAYFRPARIVDAKGVLENVGRYHQVPDAQGERAIAVWRLFAAHPRRLDPGEPPALRGPQAPYARYGVRVGLAWPW